jgi:hypothetical protein
MSSTDTATVNAKLKLTAYFAGVSSIACFVVGTIASYCIYLRKKPAFISSICTFVSASISIYLYTAMYKSAKNVNSVNMSVSDILLPQTVFLSIVMNSLFLVIGLVLLYKSFAMRKDSLDRYGFK